MNRIELLDKLLVISPALASNDMITIMTHFWFNGTHVMAYNDQIAIQVPCKTDFTGAVPGNVLLDLLKASRAKDVELTVVDDNLSIKAASSRFKLGLLPPEQFIFDMPKPSKNSLPVNTKLFLDRIENCMRSVSGDTSVPDQLGITLLDDQESISLFATNGSTVSTSYIKTTGKVPFEDRVILSTVFCQQMLRLAKDHSKALQLEVQDDFSLLTYGTTALFGRLIESEKPLNFEDIMKRHFTEADKKQLISIPTKLKLILDRAVIITDAKVDQTKTVVTVRDGRMRFSSKSDRGEVFDSMQIEDQQPEVSIKVDPRLLKNGYGFFDHMLVTETCVVMVKEDMTYLVAVSD